MVMDEFDRSGEGLVDYDEMLKAIERWITRRSGQHRRRQVQHGGRRRLRRMGRQGHNGVIPDQEQ